jgi:peptidoglycan/xylan/chitin deacetylase (PgdA/CDA1 family)
VAQGGSGTREDNPHRKERSTLKTPSVYVPGPARYPRILAYHEISARFQLGVTCIPPRKFREHLRYLREAGFDLVPLRGLAENPPPLAADPHAHIAVTLTFDDGYASFLQEALPLLADAGAPATLFLVTDYIGGYNDWDITFRVNRRRHLDWGMIREIAGRNVEIGSHTCTHRDLTRIPLEEAEQELRVSKQSLEDRLGADVTALALPFGAVNLNIFTLARRLGYREICGGAFGLYGPFPGVLPRLPVYRGDGKRALRRKLDFNALELIRVSCLQHFSRGTRLLKSRRSAALP